MNRARFVSFVALACGVLFFGASFATSVGAESMSASSEAPAVVWMPMQIGRSKTFAHRMDRTLSSAGTTLSTERLVGNREEQVPGAPSKFPEASAELRIATRTQGGKMGEEVETQQMYVSPTPAGLFEKCLVVRYTGTLSGTVQNPRCR